MLKELPNSSWSRILTESCTTLRKPQPNALSADASLCDARTLIEDENFVKDSIDIFKPALMFARIEHDEAINNWSITEK
jgi:hypothetical protein